MGVSGAHVSGLRLVSLIALCLWWSVSGAAVRGTRTAQHLNQSQQQMLSLLKQLKEEEGMRASHDTHQGGSTLQHEEVEGKLREFEEILSQLEHRVQHQDEETMSQELADVIHDMQNHKQPAPERELTVPETSYIRVAPESDRTGENAIYLSAKSPLKLTLLSRLADSSRENAAASQHVSSPAKRVSCLDYPPC